MKEFMSVIPFEYFPFQVVLSAVVPASSSSQAALPYF
jgi:hypothetical protein